MKLLKQILLKLIGIIITIFFSLNSFSQDLAAFTNYQKHFIVFDKGETKKLEHLPVKSYKIGGNAVAYISSTSELKAYYKGEIITLAETFSTDYYTSKNFVVYRIFKQLYVFDNGKTRLLSGNVNKFSVQDDIISFYNENTKSYMIYYDEKIWDIENLLSGRAVKYFKTGKNTFAYYNNNSKYLKYFLNGELIKILQVNGLIHFKTGKNILAYIDVATNSFHAYYDNEIFDLEYFRPKRYVVGNNIIAYTDNLGEFKIFEEGEINTLLSFEPETFTIVDNLLLFS